MIRQAEKESPERILTLHPQGKQGVSIDKTKYNVMRRALLRVIPGRKDGVLFQELAGQVRPHLDRSVYGKGVSINWFLVTVKQDLEARKEIEIVPGSRPQRLRRAAGGRS